MPAEQIQYCFINRAPEMEWPAGDMAALSQESFEEPIKTVQPASNPALRLGVSYVWSLLQTPQSTVVDGLKRFLKLSEQTDIPVLVQFDVQNWWGGRPDLWNWWDPSAQGYNPDNVNNVEWTGWTSDTAVKICWRNWGSQIRVLPEPNLLSPRVISAQTRALQAVLPVVAEWCFRLPKDRRYLFGGVKLGHEATVGVNAYHYPDGNQWLDRFPTDPSHDPIQGYDPAKGWSGGLAPLGHAAAAAGGIKTSGELNRDDIAEIVRRHLETLCRLAYEAGLPAEKVYTHQGGVYAPWDQHLPFTPAINAYATPGWSFYGTDPATAPPLAEALKHNPQGERWAAVEWWWGGATSDEWLDHLQRTLNYKKCQFLCIFNWDCSYSLKRDPAGIEGLRRLFAAEK